MNDVKFDILKLTKHIDHMRTKEDCDKKKLEDYINKR